MTFIDFFRHFICGKNGKSSNYYIKSTFYYILDFFYFPIFFLCIIIFVHLGKGLIESEFRRYRNEKGL